MCKQKKNIEKKNIKTIIDFYMQFTAMTLYMKYASKEIKNSKNGILKYDSFAQGWEDFMSRPTSFTRTPRAYTYTVE